MAKRINDPEKIVYIYSLNDPNDDTIKYIGWTFDMKLRLKNHISEALNASSTCYHSYKNRWIRKLKENGLFPTINLLETTTYKDHENKERYWIKFYGRKNLTNATDGGDTPNEQVPVDPWDMSKEQVIKKLSSIWLRKNSKENWLRDDLRMRENICWNKLSQEEKNEYLKNQPDIINPFNTMDEDVMRVMLMDYQFLKVLIF